MNELLSLKRVASFEALLSAYRKAGIVLRGAIDGGAGCGSTAKAMLPFIEGEIHAFEPFPGNHRFFTELDPRIRLIQKALSDMNRTMAFRVSHVVTEDSDWGKRGMSGYSSVGYLVEKPADNDLSVESVRADSFISEVDFVKLDLQGGELCALQGMGGFLDRVSLMWVEYSGQKGLLDYLDRNFVLFDTEYFFFGSPSDEARAAFHVSRENVMLSTNRPAWFGFKKRRWSSFEAEFIQAKAAGIVQTDLVCVNRSALSEFLRAAQYL